MTERVLGIGGHFVRARDPKAHAAWYRDRLGIDLVPDDYGQPSWRQQGGTTVFAPFAADTGYFGAREFQWMVNFRVRDLAAMVSQLEAAGIAVTPEGDHPNGSFARLTDPEGNPIQLWQPSGIDAGAEEGHPPPARSSP
jgi:predicted enzyme related to lactoylglutathione lyase